MFQELSAGAPLVSSALLNLVELEAYDFSTIDL